MANEFELLSKKARIFRVSITKQRHFSVAAPPSTTEEQLFAIVAQQADDLLDLQNYEIRLLGGPADVPLEFASEIVGPIHRASCMFCKATIA